jgi:hypothetical protein
MNCDNIIKLANNYQEVCNLYFLKFAVIRKLPNGKYRVMSHTGKNLGTYKSKEDAKKRLQQIEFFKHMDDNKVDDPNFPVIDLTEVEELSYSALLRKLRKKASKECVMEFLKLYNEQFNKAVKDKKKKPEDIAMKESLIIFSKKHKIKVNPDLVKGI